jgi:metal-responsive CopG/Arc/MetJ family transcriptional regulator
MKKEKVIATPMYLLPKQMKALDALAERTRIRRSELVRMAVDDLLKKYGKGGPK